MTALLITPAELNAQERLRLQLWDSDRMSADDLLGTVEVPIKELMTSEELHNKIQFREDRFCAVDGSDQPGTLRWSVGYFSKTDLQHHRPDDHEEIRRKIGAEAEEKLREAKMTQDGGDEKGEIEQQKKEDLKEKADEIIAKQRPSDEWPSGLLSVRIEQIHGLEVEKIRESGVREDTDSEESEDMRVLNISKLLEHTLFAPFESFDDGGCAWR